MRIRANRFDYANMDFFMCWRCRITGVGCVDNDCEYVCDAGALT